MMMFSAFALSLGALLALMVLIAAWLFRTANAPFAVKIVVPTIAMGLACYTPFAVAAMMGYCVPAQWAKLPDNARLIAFVPHDAEKLVDLWLDHGVGPRAYSVDLTDELKKTLRGAEESLRQGKIVMLRKQDGDGNGGKDGTPGHGKKVGEGKGFGDLFGIGGDDGHYILDETNPLPPKD